MAFVHWNGKQVIVAELSIAVDTNLQIYIWVEEDVCTIIGNKEKAQHVGCESMFDIRCDDITASSCTYIKTLASLMYAINDNATVACAKWGRQRGITACVWLDLRRHWSTCVDLVIDRTIPCRCCTWGTFCGALYAVRSSLFLQVWWTNHWEWCRRLEQRPLLYSLICKDKVSFQCYGRWDQNFKAGAHFAFSSSLHSAHLSGCWSIRFARRWSVQNGPFQCSTVLIGLFVFLRVSGFPYRRTSKNEKKWSPLSFCWGRVEIF